MKKFSMKKLARVIPIAAMCMLTLSAGSVSAKKDQVPLPTYQNSYNNYIQPIATAIDYYTGNIYLFNYENDKLVIIDPVTIIGWPQNGSTRIPLQHTIVSPDGSKVYITTDATDLYPAYIIALKMNSVDWNAGSASLAVENMMTADAAGTPGEFPFVEPVNDVQNVPNWVIGRATQIHGPTILPFSDFVYFTEFTSNRVRVVNTKTDELVSGVDPIVIPGYTENTHGVNFNKSGTIGLGTGYFFDNSVIDVYKPDNGTGQLQPVGQIQLGNEKKHAAFSHFTAWIDERYAVTATMQLDKTSLTPSTTEQIIPPSVWLLDAIEGTATKILDRAANANAPGVFRSASDLTVVNGKLYIAEEDSIDFTFADDGYISIYDLTDRTKPKFIKRLKPGVDLPAGFAIAHTIAPTPDNRYLIVASWASGYVLKIDTLTDTVVKVWGPNDGLVKPHGIYTAGQIR